MEFTTTTVTVKSNAIIVLEGHRTPSTQLWHIQLPEPTVPAQTNVAIGSATATELVTFAHSSLWSPVLTKLATALTKGYLANFPGLSSRTLRHNPPQSKATIKGHLDQSCKNQCSTKAHLITPDSAPANSELNTEAFPATSPSGDQSHFCYTAIMAPTGQIYVGIYPFLSMTEIFTIPQCSHEYPRFTVSVIQNHLLSRGCALSHEFSFQSYFPISK